MPNEIIIGNIDLLYRYGCQASILAKPVQFTEEEQNELRKLFKNYKLLFVDNYWTIMSKK